MRRKAIIALVFIVAAAVLVESWQAAANAAASGGRPAPLLWPVTLEAFIFVLVLAYWDARSARERAWPARVMLAVTTVVASAVQILDAPHTWLGWLTAGWTPVALLLSVEFAVGRLYGIRTSDPVPAKTPPSEQPPAPGAASTRPRVAQDGVRTRGRPVTLGRPSGLTPEQRQQIADLFAAGKGGKEIQRTLGMSDRAYRERVLPLLRSLRDQPVQVHRNGTRPDHVTPVQVRQPGGGS